YFVGETITPAVSKGDVFIAVSGSGKSKNVINDAESAKQKGCILITVTGKSESPLSNLADRKIVIPGTVKADSGDQRTSIQLLSSLFDQSLHIVLDMLCLMLSRRDHMSNEEATRSHW
ncbi:MAG: SIS domain-containing protein, partial [Blautia sp.]|nr:SIS domain-containing protein [Blautia sp.]